MGQSGLARVALFFGGLAAVVSWWTFAASQTILDSQATTEAATGLLRSSAIREQAANSLAEQLESVLAPVPGASGVPAKSVAVQALSDPRVTDAFATALGSLHKQLLEPQTSHKRLVVDTSAVSKAVRTAVRDVNPKAAAALKGKSFEIAFDTSGLPNLHQAQQQAPRYSLIAALIAIALWLLAILIHPNHLTAISRIGRRLITIGIAPVFMWVVLPFVLDKIGANAAATLSPLSKSYGKRLTLPAVIILLIGVGIVVFAKVSRSGSKQRTADRPSVNGAATSDRSPDHNLAHGPALRGTHRVGSRTNNSLWSFLTYQRSRPTRRARSRRPDVTSTDRLDLKL